jgi:dienelactone hydrolase
MRVSGSPQNHVVVCVNGGQGGLVEGTWSASLEWLVSRLASRFPQVGFAEVRYRIKSWNRLQWCIDDCRAAIRELAAEHTMLCGFSMGGGVAIACADEPSVERVLGIAPWIPDQLDVSPIHGKQFDVLHGSLDRPLPGIPGVSPANSRRGFDRAQTQGTYTLIPGALHGIAVRARSGRPVPLPRARTWERLVATQVEAFVTASATP